MSAPARVHERVDQPARFTPVLVPTTSSESASAALKLASYTGLILFFELAWIRYTSGYVRVFGFYQNFVLIATFLGMGVGLLRASSAPRLQVAIAACRADAVGRRRSVQRRAHRGAR